LNSKENVDNDINSSNKNKNKSKIQKNQKKTNTDINKEGTEGEGGHVGMEWININIFYKLFRISFDDYSRYGLKGSDSSNQGVSLASNRPTGTTTPAITVPLREKADINQAINPENSNKALDTIINTKDGIFQECFVIEKLEARYSNVYKNLSYYFKFQLIDRSNDYDALNDSLNDSADINIDSLNETLSIAYNENNEDKLTMDKLNESDDINIDSLNETLSIAYNKNNEDKLTIDKLNESDDINIDSLNETLSIAYNKNNEVKFTINNQIKVLDNQIHESKEEWSLEINGNIVNKTIQSKTPISIPMSRNIQKTALRIELYQKIETLITDTDKKSGFLSSVKNTLMGGRTKTANSSEGIYAYMHICIYINMCICRYFYTVYTYVLSLHICIYV
jgi:hypothetical protein